MQVLTILVSVQMQNSVFLGASEILVRNMGKVNVISRRSDDLEYHLVAHCCFDQPGEPSQIELAMNGGETEILFEGVLTNHERARFEMDGAHVNGVEAAFKFKIRPEGQCGDMVRIQDDMARLFLLPGAVVILKTKLGDKQLRENAKKVKKSFKN